MWHLGQEIVCVKVDSFSNSFGGQLPPLILNKVYKIKGLSLCQCGLVSIDVGGQSLNEYIICECGIVEKNHGIRWCSEKRFVPLDDISIEEVNEILEENDICNT